VCPHATIRPFALTDEELKGAPASLRTIDAKGPHTEGLHYVQQVDPLDCMGCGVCATVCPTNALTMVPAAQEQDQQAAFDYCFEEVSDKPQLVANNVKGSQFKQPLLEFSGSCAGCAETSYARLITQVCGDRMFISNATGCSSIWGNPAPPGALHRQRRATARRGTTRCSRTTPSTATAWRLATRRAGPSGRGDPRPA
jgi:pyruvate-ferredoxin/flavodoxin oxidoreductase